MFKQKDVCVCVCAHIRVVFMLKCARAYILDSSIEAAQHRFHTVCNLLRVFVKVHQHTGVYGRDVSWPTQ